MSTTERNETVSPTQLAPINMTKDAANPDFGTMPEDYEGYNSRPLDDIPLTKYNSETDRGTLCKSLENYIETNPNQAANNLPQGSDIQKEAVQAINGGKDAEVRNDAVEDFINQMESKAPSQQSIDEDAYRKQLNDMDLKDDIDQNIDNYEMLHFTPEEDKQTAYTWAPGSFMRKDIRDSVYLINSYPTSQKRAALELLARIDNGEIDSYEDMMKANPWMSEDMFYAISSIASNDNKGRIPVITKSSLKRNKAAKSRIESLVEEHPEVIKETVPEDNPIHKEAEQVTDGDARTTEANNEKIEEGIKQGGIDWDKIERNWNAEHEAAANPSSEYKDEFGRDVPDFVSNDEPALDEAVNEALSEYFDNTDELYDYLMDNGYGDDVFDPGLEDQNQYSDSPINEDDLAKADETIYDESMASQPTISEKRLEPAPEAPNADNVVQIKEDEELDEAIDEAIDEATDGFKMPHFEIGGGADQLSAPHGSISPSGEVFMNKTPGSSFGRMFSNISPSNSAGAVNAASINGSGATKFTSATTAAHSGTGSPSVSTPNEAAAVTIGSKQGTENNGNLTANGVYNSGAVNHSGTSLKASNIKLPNGETRSGQNASVGLDGNAIDLKDAHIENLESRIRSIPTNLAEQLGFGTKYKHVTYNGLGLKECGPREIQEIEKILSTLGV